MSKYLNIFNKINLWIDLTMETESDIIRIGVGVCFCLCFHWIINKQFDFYQVTISSLTGFPLFHDAAFICKLKIFKVLVAQNDFKMLFVLDVFMKIKTNTNSL